MVHSTMVAAAALAARAIDKSLKESIPDDIVNCIYGFAAGAAALAFTPVPGLDIALVTADVWTMYVRINKHLGISFSDNLMKSIGSAIAGNLTANAGSFVVAGALKLFPGIGSAIGGAVMAATTFGTTMAAGLVYLKAITRFYNGGKNGGDLSGIVADVMKEDADEIKRVQNEGKDEYKNGHK